MTELTQPEKLGRHIIEQYLDSRGEMDSLQMSIDILTKLANGSLEISRSPVESEWNAAVEECARYAESRYPDGVNDSLAASFREKIKRGTGK